MNSIIRMDEDVHREGMSSGFFDLYHRDSFKQPARETWIAGWKVEYMAIATPETAHQTPILIVGGAFQNFNSYKYCVEQLFQCGPVILIDLPSMGANQQITNRDSGVSAATLELPDLARILVQWLEQVQLSKISVMGMSLGSVIASCFADLRPDMVERLVLMGVMQKTRKSWRMILEESLKLMQEDRMSEFGQAVILYLVNHAKLDQTRMSPTAKRLFFQQMSEFNATERLRYQINCERLLRLTDVPVPTCETLVAAGQFDSFTLPYENANFALQCPNMQFALIANADHVPQLQRRKETMRLFEAFLSGRSIHQLDGILPMTRDQMQMMERRGEIRIQVNPSKTKLTHRLHDHSIDVQIVDLSFFGVFFRLEQLMDLNAVNDAPRDLALHLHDDEGSFQIECLIFEAEASGVRAIFKHGSFTLADRLLRYVERQKQRQQHFAAVV
ncbi:alpha/beta fold hydrolase [Acinetobacter soli]|uniref:alpha/beta fold hydrolase n=1 Tax=Acinetobacter soli TaxID=487316 RepID=UPI00124FE45D|nr:alpha/beta hydrolase [Acinetobacter soli]MCE6007060.1 alpha/beta hydrolase [Acinetobacter soli]